MKSDGTPIVSDEEVAPLDCPSPLSVRVLTDQEAYNLRRYGRYHAAPSDPGEFWVNGVLTNGGNR